MASEVEHRQRVARSGGGGGNVNNNNNNSSVGVVTASSKPPRRNRPPQLVARSATDRFWGLLNGEPGVPSPVSAVGAPSPLFLDAAEASEDDDEEEEEGGSSNVASPITSPPYWTTNAHTRSVSNTSVESFLPAGAITLQDNENDDDSGSNVYGRDRNRACWAKSVQVTDFVIVNGSATNIGAFVVWNIKVETLNGSYMNICKRYSEFDDLRVRLLQTFPNFKAAMPELPPKSVISKFRPRFLERRRAGLQYFLNCILLNPEFSGSPVLKDFLFS